MKNYIKEFVDKFRGKTNQPLNEVQTNVDNFELIKPLLKFEELGDFYFLQVILRKKDGLEGPLGNRNNSYRTVKTYYIRSLEDLEEKQSEIVSLCKQYKARAYINLNVRNIRNILFSMIIEATTLLEGNQIEQGYNILEHLCGITPKKGVKKSWIVDVDTKDEEILNVVKTAVNLCRSVKEVGDHYDNIITTVPTRAGYHLITIGFNKSQLMENIYAEADKAFGDNRAERLPDEMIAEIIDSIKIDNPTLLYFNK